MQRKLGIGKEKRGITLLALVITVIILVILAGVGISAISSGNIFDNAINVVEQSKIASKKEEIELVIISKMKNSVREITIDKIIEALEKKGIIDAGNSNEETGQVKTNPDGYIYEIIEKPNGDWDVKYEGKGELDTRKIKLTTELSTTVITDKVTITVTAKASAGIKSITMPDGSIKTYTGKTEVSETYEVTQNGKYTFTATNNKGENESKTITIDNILEGTIQISANPSEATNKSVIVTIEWPNGSENAIKEICSNGENKYTTVSGVRTTLTLNNNCVIKARIRNSIAEIKTATLNVTNIDKLAPNIFTPTATTTSNSITITGKTTDQPATEKYGSSGIAEYYFSKDNGTSWQTNEDKTQTSYTYTELTQGTEYTLKMKAIDKAGNETITDSITATTINIANLGDIQISATPSTPTNKDVTVTVTWPNDTTGLTKKISKDNGDNWSDYTGPITVSSNCIVKAKLIDTTSQEGKTATANITNIDKTDPTVTAKQSSVTITEGASNALSNYFTITANGTYGISSTIYTDTSNSNVQVTNTNTLKVGTHTIKCTATKETGATASTTITITVNSAKPAYTEKSWTTAGTYTWICPSGVTRIRVAVCGGGGGGTNREGKTGNHQADNGTTSNFGNLIAASGGTGAYYSGGYYEDTENWSRSTGHVGTGGSPNGKNGINPAYNTSTTGFALSFSLTNGNYGTGGGSTQYNYSFGGGTGGYNSGYVNVSAGKTYSVTVGKGGTGAYQGTAGVSGFVLIAYGGDI